MNLCLSKVLMAKSPRKAWWKPCFMAMPFGRKSQVVTTSVTHRFTRDWKQKITSNNKNTKEFCGQKRGGMKSPEGNTWEKNSSLPSSWGEEQWVSYRHEFAGGWCHWAELHKFMIWHPLFLFSVFLHQPTTNSRFYLAYLPPAAPLGPVRLRESLWE